MQQGTATSRTFEIPGRVCLFGDKIDLKGLPVIAATVNRTMRLEITRLPRPSRQVSLFSSNFNSGVTFSLDDPLDGSEPWRSHPLKSVVLYWGAVATRLRERIGGFEARLESDIPIGKGMASSGAVSVGLTRALNEVFGLGMTCDDIAKIAYLAEHDNLQIPCGRMDQWAIAVGGVTHITTNERPVVTALRVPGSCAPLGIVVGDTLEPRPLQKLLGEFREKLGRRDPLVEEVFEKIAQGVEEGRRALEKGDLEEVGECMRRQMVQERRVGCITPGLERLCKAAEGAGAYGAKLTGVGGGGCMVALCRPGRQQDVADAITSVGGKAWIVEVVSYAPDGSVHRGARPADRE